MLDSINDDGPRVVVYHDSRGHNHYTLVVDNGSYFHDGAGKRYNLVPAPEPVDIAALRDAAIDALLVHRAKPSSDNYQAANTAAEQWATAAGHRDQ